jgi:hypothetical protein
MHRQSAASEKPARQLPDAAQRTQPAAKSSFDDMDDDIPF